MVTARRQAPGREHRRRSTLSPYSWRSRIARKNSSRTITESMLAANSHSWCRKVRVLLLLMVFFALKMAFYLPGAVIGLGARTRLDMDALLPEPCALPGMWQADIENGYKPRYRGSCHQKSSQQVRRRSALHQPKKSHWSYVSSRAVDRWHIPRSRVDQAIKSFAPGWYRLPAGYHLSAAASALLLLVKQSSDQTGLYGA